MTYSTETKIALLEKHIKHLEEEMGEIRDEVKQLEKENTSLKNKGWVIMGGVSVLMAIFGTVAWVLTQYQKIKDIL